MQAGKMLCTSALVYVGLSLFSACFAQDYVVEVLLVVDALAKEKWEAEAKSAGNTLYQEIRSVMFEVNELYRNLQQQGLDIAIHLVNNKIQYVDEDIISEDLVTEKDGETYVDYKLAIADFSSWSRGKSFDAAIYITGHKSLYPTTAGIAMLDTVCTGGVGTVSLSPTTFTLVGTIAHELAHILGVYHDGDGNFCAQKKGYLMAPSKISGLDHLHKYVNNYYWSTCSAKALQKSLPTRSCLRPEETTTKAIKAQRLGRLISADETCRRYGYKQLSRYSYETGNYNGMCHSIACEVSLQITTKTKKVWFVTISKSTNYQSVVVYASPPPGMQCGQGKSCSNENCVPDTKARKPWDSHCPFGDTPSLENGLHTCENAKSKGKCDLSNFKRICCQSCR